MCEKRNLLIEQMGSAITTLFPENFHFDIHKPLVGSHDPKISEPGHRLAVSQMRARLGDSKVLATHRDFDLVRFLKARNFNIEETVSMYEQMLGYRKRYRVDEPNFIRDFEPLEVFVKCYPNGVLGTDRQGYPVVYDLPGMVDVRGFSQAMSDEELCGQLMWSLENLERVMEQMSEARASLVDKWTVVIDVQHLGWEHLSTSQLARGRKVQQLFDVCYPERMHKLLFVNISRCFHIGFQLFRPFIPQATRDKVVMLVDKQLLTTYIPPENLPVYYGGQKVDDKGDPKCTQWINYGCKVPQSLYKSNILADISRSWSKVQLAPGQAHRVTLEAVAGDVLSYSFYTDSGHVNFGICLDRAEDTEGVTERLWVKHMARCNSELQLVHDSVEVDQQGKYCLVFDNKTSWTISKSLTLTFNCNTISTQ